LADIFRSQNHFSLLALAAFTACAIYASLANAAPADITACDRLATQAETTR
jgi:hypothetical protein